MKEGGDQIEYEDPQLREIYPKELAKVGIEFNLTASGKDDE